MEQKLTIEVVRAALRGPRLGLRAQVRMMPRPRFWDPWDTMAKHGGVLLLLYPQQGELHLVLTQRTDRLPNHKGQVSFPGGACDPGESFMETALREAEEELGIDPAQVQVLGELTPLYISASNFCIHPVVGYTPSPPVFRPNPREVAKVLQVPVTGFLDPATVHEETWPWRGIKMRVPYFLIEGEYKVWGATAMVLAEFAELMAMTLRTLRLRKEGES